MEYRGISPTDFALNHPAGSLDKALTLTSADLMMPASQLHPLQTDTRLLKVIGGLKRDGIGSGWSKIPRAPETRSACSRMVICVLPCKITALKPGAI